MVNIVVSEKTRKTRIENKMPVAREGLPFILTGVVISLILASFGFFIAAILMGIISLFIIYFFRDPERKNDASTDALLAPADGKIVNIRHISNSNNPLNEPAIKVSIFMSIFNVHVNRIPADGRVSEIVYSPGKFLSANLDKASDQNENNKITLETIKGQRIVFVQIAGLIARRIVCWIKKQDSVTGGQRFGIIRFGSRLDLYMPINSRIIIHPKDKVSAGETIIGYLP